MGGCWQGTILYDVNGQAISQPVSGLSQDETVRGWSTGKHRGLGGIDQIGDILTKKAVRWLLIGLVCRHW